jgi:hypothetical protein
MIVGNGLISNAFKGYENDDSIIIFASGVSDSTCNDKEKFERELNLIRKFVLCKQKFIYFGTSNIGETEYFHHKEKMEKFIINNFQNYLIFKIPNIIGFGGHEKNLVNFFKNKLVNNEEICVQKTTRAIIDVNDLKLLCEKCFNLINQIVVISYIERVEVTNIVEILSKILDVEPKIFIVPSYNNSKIENSEIINRLITENIEIDNYTTKVLEKYVNK